MERGERVVSRKGGLLPPFSEQRYTMCQIKYRNTQRLLLLTYGIFRSTNEKKMNV
jgi:hypothetical protein